MSEFCSVCSNLYELSSDGNIPIQLCPVCGHINKLPPNTLLYSKITSLNQLNKTYNILNQTDQKIHCPVLLKTKNYTCPNNKCDTHKHPENKSASIERINSNIYKVYYICDICGTSWQ